MMTNIYVVLEMTDCVTELYPEMLLLETLVLNQLPLIPDLHSIASTAKCIKVVLLHVCLNELRSLHFMVCIGPYNLCE